MADGADSFDLDAAGVRAELADLARDVEVLAVKLEDALPDQTTVARRAKRFLSKERVVEGVEVRIGDKRYVLAVDGKRVDARCATEVRGVVIRREELDLGGWLEALAGDLRDEATSSARARGALDRLLG